jgi:phosphatidylglycerophosphate synthase
MPSIEDLKKVAFNQDEPYTYKFFRRISIYFSYIFIRLKITPSQISVGWLFLLLAASVLLAIDTAKFRYFAALLIILHFCLDCSDGEIARSTGRMSRIGSNLEQIIHWITNLSLIAGIAWGQFRQSANPSALLLGSMCLISDACFHFLYIQLSYWMDECTNYGFLHKITTSLYTVMPLNINLFLLGCLFNAPYLSLLLWGIITSVVFLVLLATFFGKEFSLLKK